MARPTSLAPIHHQRRAYEWLQECGRAAAHVRLAEAGALGALDLLDALRSPMNLRNGAALAALARDGHAPWPSVRPRDLVLVARMRLYQGKRMLSQARRDLLARVHRVAGQPAGRGDVLVLPRLLGHVHDQMPVALELRRQGMRVVFALPTPELVDLPREQGFEVASLDAVAAGRAPGPLAAHRLQRALERAVGDFADGPTAARFSAREREVLTVTTQAVLREQVNGLQRVAHGLDRLLQTLTPTLLLIGNPYTIEGRAAAMLARARGIRSAALEHGSTFPDDPIWRDCLVDLVCACGAPSRRALLSCGVADSAIAVTGAPRLDAVIQRRSQAQPASILVATSGAGDQVSAETHAHFIEWLYAASETAPEVRWVVKLHLKDPPALYAEASARHPRARIEIVLPDSRRFGADIFDYLRGARALVTVCSTTALDAMVVGVPVIAVEPGPIPRGVEFLERGCTRSARDATELAYQARRAWAEEAVPGVDEAARAYAAEHHVNLGSAATAVAQHLRQLLEARARG